MMGGYAAVERWAPLEVVLEGHHHVRCFADKRNLGGRLCQEGLNDEERSSRLPSSTRRRAHAKPAEPLGSGARDLWGPRALWTAPTRRRVGAASYRGTEGVKVVPG